MARSPISRVGGKFYLANEIIKYFPEHERYIESFGGAMHTLFRKQPSGLEIFNDIDSALVTFFKVVKNHPEELLKMLDFSLCSREVFFDAKKGLDRGTELEIAYNFYMTNRLSFNGKMASFGVTSSGITGFFTYEKRIREAHERIKNVCIEHMDFRKLIKKYDSANALFFCDPPYIFNEHRGKDKFYPNEMTDNDHADLVQILKNIKGKFILSGYENPLYSCFERIDLGESNMYVKKTCGAKRSKKSEYIWKNF